MTMIDNTNVQTEESNEVIMNKLNLEESMQYMHRGMIAEIFNDQAIENWTVLMVKLVGFGLDKYKAKWDEVYARIKRAKLEDALNGVIKEYYGTILKTGNHDELKELAASVKYNIMTLGLELNKKDPYSAYKVSDDSTILNLKRVQKYISNDSSVSNSFIESISQNGKQIKESKIARCYGYGVAYGYYNDNLRLSLLSEIVNNLDCDNEIETALTYLELNTSDNNNYKNIVETLLNGVRLSKLILSYNRHTFDKSPKTIIEKYIGKGNTKEHYSMFDFLYRKMIYFYSEANRFSYRKNECSFLLKKIKLINKAIENKYISIIYNLNDVWIKSLASYDFNYEKIKKENDFALQSNFFQDNVANETENVAVIVSSGLRYEVAEELMRVINQNHGNIKSDMGWNLGSVPSTYMFGNANLLPHKEINFVKPSESFDTGHVELNGIRLGSLDNYCKILESSVDRSKVATAVNSEDVFKNSDRDNKILFCSDIVYVYHSEITYKAHVPGHAFGVIRGSERAVKNLTKLVNKLIDSNVKRIIITADHGFLFSNKHVNSINLFNSPSSDSIVDKSSRHILSCEHISKSRSGYSFDLNNTIKCKAGYQVQILNSTNLFSNGFTTRYAVGGASLQEIVLPVLKITVNKDNR